MRPAPRCATLALTLLALTLANSPLHAQALDPILPDPRLTPGATVVIGHDALCTPGYSHGVR